MAKPKKAIVKEPKDSRIQTLRNRVRKLEKENHRLKSELKTYEEAFKKTYNFLRDDLEEYSLEALIKASNNDQSKKELKKKVHDEPNELTKEQVREKWAKWRKENL